MKNPFKPDVQVEEGNILETTIWTSMPRYRKGDSKNLKTSLSWLTESKIEQVTSEGMGDDSGFLRWVAIGGSNDGVFVIQDEGPERNLKAAYFKLVNGSHLESREGKRVTLKQFGEALARENNAVKDIGGVYVVGVKFEGEK